MTDLENKALYLLAKISRRNILSQTDDPLQTETHTLLQKEIDYEYKNLSTKELEYIINSL